MRNLDQTSSRPSRSGSSLGLWIAVVLAFVLLITAWVTLISIANRNRAPSLPLPGEEVEPAPAAPDEDPPA